MLLHNIENLPIYFYLNLVYFQNTGLATFSYYIK